MTTDQALQHLTPQQLQLIQLRDTEKRKWNDVASAMGISLNYAMKLHKEAKAELSRLMALDETKLFKPRALAGPWGFEAEPEALPKPKWTGMRGSISDEEKAVLESKGVKVIQHTICDMDPPFTSTTAVVVGVRQTPPDPIPAPMEAIPEPPPAKPKVVVAKGVPQKVVWVHGVIVPQPPPEPPRRWSSVTIQS